MRFIDRVRIVARGGKGGNGCLSFLHEKYREFGGPNGGNGGRGGDVILEADPNLSTLLDVSFRPHLYAQEGANGKSGMKTGLSAEDLRLKVPTGTVVLRGGIVVADLARPGQTFVAARGGRGGRGNQSFKSHENTEPRIYEKGEPGEEAELDLELKLIADVGLAGFPNAGKSTLLARLSNARPKVADYPFTTLSPHLGIVSHKEKSFVMADVPGLIEGASEGKGLGDDFLRHVERTRILLHLIDPAGFDGRSARDGVRVIEEELKSYSRLLGGKSRILVVTKADLPEAREAYRQVKARYRSRQVFLISAATGEGLSALLDAVLKELSKHPRDPVMFVPDEAPSLKVAKGFEVCREEPGAFRVRGRFVERAAAMADMGLEQSVERLQNSFKKIGLDKALRSAGVQDGDMVRIGALELVWANARAERPKLGRRRKPRKTIFPRGTV